MLALPVGVAGQEVHRDTIPESKVTAGRGFDDVMPVQRLDGRRLERLGAHSVADAIRFFSGVQIKDYGGAGGLKTVNVRSLGSEHTHVMYDGVEIWNAQNGQVDLGRFSLENMEAVVLSSSTVSLVPKAPEFSSGKVWNLRAGISYGSFATFSPSLVYERRLSRRVNNSLSAGFMTTSGRYPFSYTKKDGYDTTAVRRNGDVRTLRVEDALYGSFDGGEWRARLYWYNSQRGYPGAFVREEPGRFAHEDRQWDNDLFLQSSLVRRWESVRLRASSKLAASRLHYLSDPRLDVTTMYVDNTYRQRSAYLSASAEGDLRQWWDASVMSEWQLDALDADLYGFVHPVRNTLLTTASTSVHIPRLRLSAGLLHTFVHDRTDEGNTVRNMFSPSASTSFDILEDGTLGARAFVKGSCRMPSFNDLYYTFIGNKELEPETATQLDAGLFWNRVPGGAVRKLEMSCDVYRNEVFNKIVAVPASNQFRWTMMNLGHVLIHGVDLVAAASAQAGQATLSSRLTYTFQDASDVTDASSPWYGGQIPYIPRHSGSAVLGASFGRLSADCSFIYTGGRYDSSANIPENHIQPWYTTDLSFTGSFDWLGRESSLTFQINNLFNQQYEVVRCYPMPGINFRLAYSVII